MEHGTHSDFIADMYNAQAETYAAFKEASFAWQFIEKPAFDRYLTDQYIKDLPNLYRSDVSVLDVGCGSGLIVQHLVSQGLSARNITAGIDLSRALLEEAQRRIPEARFLEASADSFELPSESVDLITSNMVFHYLDNDQLATAFGLMYDVLKPGGTLFFVDADPDYSEETRLPENTDQWLELPTPWGGTAPWFCRHPDGLLSDMAYAAGFDLVAGAPLTVDEAGKAFPEQYAKYTSYPARMAVRLQKIPPEKRHPLLPVFVVHL